MEGLGSALRLSTPDAVAHWDSFRRARALPLPFFFLVLCASYMCDSRRQGQNPCPTGDFPDSTRIPLAGLFLRIVIYYEAEDMIASNRKCDAIQVSFASLPEGGDGAERRRKECPAICSPVKFQSPQIGTRKPAEGEASVAQNIKKRTVR